MYLNSRTYIHLQYCSYEHEQSVYQIYISMNYGPVASLTSVDATVRT